MEKYCDPSFVSILANNRKYFGQEQCLQNQRDDACARFHGLPQEVKTVLDEAISCLFSNGSGYVSDTMKNESEECGVTYMKRIELLKKYLGEAYSSYALVFLPDTVLDTGGACVNRR